MKQLSRAITVRPGAKRKPTKKDVLRQFAADRGWSEIGEEQWTQMRAALPDISASTIRESGLEIRAPWCGVNAHTFEDLDASLRAFSAVYAARPDLHRYCRDEVIATKERARWAAKNPKVDENKRAMKAEMVEWMLVWLDDPSVFPLWAQLRLDILSGKNAIH
jgi:hypothetical protein